MLAGKHVRIGGVAGSCTTSILEYNNAVGLSWSRSAEKHYPIADAIHALQHRIAFIIEFDVARDGSEEVVDLVIGPARDGRALEVFIHRRNQHTIHIFHVLHLREKTQQRAQQVIARDGKD